MLLERRQEVRSNNFNLASRLLVEEAFNNGPNSTEKHRRVHNEQVAHDLGIVIRANLGSELAQAVGLLICGRDATMGHIKDGQALANVLTFDSGTGWELMLHQLLVLLDVVSDHSFFRCNLKKSGDIEKTEAFDVDGPPKFVNTVVSVWIDFLDGCALIKLVSVDHGVNFRVSPPVNEVCPHDLHLGQVELSGTTKPQNIMLTEVQLLHVAHFCRRHPFFELRNDLVLFGRCVAHEASLDGRCGF